MKKYLLIYSLILVAVYVLLSALGRDSNYIIERKIWKIYQEQKDIARDPAVIPDNVFERVIHEYKQIIEKYSYSSHAPDLYIRLGEVHALRRDFAAARELFQSLAGLYPEKKDLLAEAMFKVGETYEAENNWPEAERVYQQVIREYPLTDVGLKTSIYIANYYRGQNDFQGTMTAYEAAMSRYKDIAVQFQDTQVGLSALRHLATCYLDQKRWEEAIAVLGQVIERYAGSSGLNIKDTDMVIKTINIVSAYQIKDYDVAIGLYQDILKRNPGHPLRKYLLKVIDAFNQLKEKGVQVSER
ncbi:MAG: hypothetical protein A3C36_05785 [Omnitrophica WOR_2 bacterium RIFCSPHIGHO2_02_FULL_52_10]|nr:MAG: hypothetical protein A3C36_05785 [Omnitrophica WOR_2 bacterium RIFCSPHIGHO2_02_FULL_52_10]